MVTYMAPKLRHALDDMQISRVKRTALAAHETASSVTPNLQQTDHNNTVWCVCRLPVTKCHVIVIQHAMNSWWRSIMNRTVTTEMVNRADETKKPRTFWTLSRILTVFFTDQNKSAWNTTNNNNNRFMALCLWLPGWAATRRNTHHPPSWSSNLIISFFHVPRSTASSLFKLCAWQSFCTTSFHVFFGLPLPQSASLHRELYTVWMRYSSPDNHQPAVSSRPVFVSRPHLFHNLPLTSRFFHRQKTTLLGDNGTRAWTTRVITQLHSDWELNPVTYKQPAHCATIPMRGRDNYTTYTANNYDTPSWHKQQWHSQYSTTSTVLIIYQQTTYSYYSTASRRFNTKHFFGPVVTTMVTITKFSMFSPVSPEVGDHLWAQHLGR